MGPGVGVAFLFCAQTDTVESHPGAHVCRYSPAFALSGTVLCIDSTVGALKYRALEGSLIIAPDGNDAA